MSKAPAPVNLTPKVPVAVIPSPAVNDQELFVLVSTEAVPSRNEGVTVEIPPALACDALIVPPADKAEAVLK